MLREERLESYVETAWAIAASPYCSEFIIGFTARAGNARLAEYARALGYQHLVVLADKLTRDDAHQLEEALQSAVKMDKKHVLYRKYNADKRDAPYHRSSGQATADPLDPIHSVYMAWLEE